MTLYNYFLEVMPDWYSRLDNSLERLNALVLSKEEEVEGLEARLALIDAYFAFRRKEEERLSLILRLEEEKEKKRKTKEEKVPFDFFAASQNEIFNTETLPSQENSLVVKLTGEVASLLGIDLGVLETEVFVEANAVFSAELSSGGVLDHYYDDFEFTTIDPELHKFYTTYEEVCGCFGICVPTYLKNKLWVLSEGLESQVQSTYNKMVEESPYKRIPLLIEEEGENRLMWEDFYFLALKGKMKEKRTDSVYYNKNLLLILIELDLFVSVFPAENTELNWLHREWSYLGILQKVVFLSKVRGVDEPFRLLEILVSGIG
jgi:hypothetical protein